MDHAVLKWQQTLIFQGLTQLKEGPDIQGHHTLLEDPSFAMHAPGSAMGRRQEGGGSCRGLHVLGEIMCD